MEKFLHPYKNVSFPSPTNVGSHNIVRSISASGGLGLSQLVSKPDTRWCASKDTGLKRGWTLSSVSARTLGHEGGGHQAMWQ